MSNSLTPAQRSMRAKLGAHAQWASTEDRTERTAPARAAFYRRFEKQVDPDGVLDPAERAKRAENARQAHMLRLALASAKARRLRAQVVSIETALEDEDPELAEEAAQLDREATSGGGVA